MKIDTEIRSFGKNNGVPITLDETLNFLLETINSSNYKVILEIGTAIGYGCITMAENTIGTHIDTVEIDKERYDIARQNVVSHKLTDRISTNLIDAMDYIKKCEKKYDLIYLDGPKGQYINYLPYLIDMLNVGGVIVADNLYFHGMVTGEIPVSKGCRAMIKGLKKYIEAINSHPKLESTILNIGDGVGVSKKKTD